MRRVAPLVLVLVTTSLIALAAAPLLGAVAPPPGDLGEPADVRHVTCVPPGQLLRAAFYDYVPEDPDFWRAIALYVGSEPHWFFLIVWDQPVEGSALSVWVDRNRDGQPEVHERFSDTDAMIARYGQTFCTTYERVLGRPG